MKRARTYYNCSEGYTFYTVTINSQSLKIEMPKHTTEELEMLRLNENGE